MPFPVLQLICQLPEKGQKEEAVTCGCRGQYFHTRHDRSYWDLWVLQTAVRPWCPGHCGQQGPLGLGQAVLLSLAVVAMGWSWWPWGGHCGCGVAVLAVGWLWWLWGGHGVLTVAMGQLWGSRRAAVGQLWGSHRVAMGRPWGGYGAAMGRLWGSHGVLTGLWQR